jgi:site-specific DNA-cytosine methylase
MFPLGGASHLFQRTNENDTESSLLNVVDFVVPQFRERVFIVGFRDGFQGFAWPNPTHVPTDQKLLIKSGLKPHVTVREALQGLDHLPNHLKRIHGPRVAGGYAKTPPDRAIYIAVKSAISRNSFTVTGDPVAPISI